MDTRGELSIRDAEEEGSFMTTDTDSCPSCETLLAPGQSHCSCGRPTSYASFEERAAFEVAQWRAYLERSAAAR